MGGGGSVENRKVGTEGIGHPVEGGRPGHRDADVKCGCHVREKLGPLGYRDIYRPGEYIPVKDGQRVVTFDTGATRSTEPLFDPEGFISPEVLRAYSLYMERHRVQKDGQTRASDNWQKGMPTSRAFRSLTRHFLDAWLIHRGYKPHSEDCGGIRDALCGMLFNVMLLLKNEMDGQHHEEVK